ncbi:MAG: hypothetical protein NTX45_22275 [Proteobacteria bacterium]|nr:hypothetical protein [Pseudomonadota bacterium]
MAKNKEMGCGTILLLIFGSIILIIITIAKAIAYAAVSLSLVAMAAAPFVLTIAYYFKSTRTQRLTQEILKIKSQILILENNLENLTGKLSLKDQQEIFGVEIHELQKKLRETAEDLLFENTIKLHYYNYKRKELIKKPESSVNIEPYNNVISDVMGKIDAITTTYNITNIPNIEKSKSIVIEFIYTRKFLKALNKEKESTFSFCSESDFTGYMFLFITFSFWVPVVATAKFIAYNFMNVDQLNRTVIFLKQSYMSQHVSLLNFIIENINDCFSLLIAYSIMFAVLPVLYLPAIIRWKGLDSIKRFLIINSIMGVLMMVINGTGVIPGGWFSDITYDFGKFGINILILSGMYPSMILLLSYPFVDEWKALRP